MLDDLLVLVLSRISYDEHGFNKLKRIKFLFQQVLKLICGNV